MPKCFNVCVERHKRGPIACEDCMELKDSKNVKKLKKCFDIQSPSKFWIDLTHGESEDEHGKQNNSDLDRQDRR